MSGHPRDLLTQTDLSFALFALRDDLAQNVARYEKRRDTMTPAEMAEVEAMHAGMRARIARFDAAVRG